MSNFGKILKVPPGGRSRSEDQKKSVIAQKKTESPLDLPIKGRFSLVLKDSKKNPRRIQMLEFQVENMSCGSCANVISKAIKTIDPNVQVSVDVVSQTVRVKSGRSEKELANLIEECGYPVSKSTVV